MEPASPPPQWNVSSDGDALVVEIPVDGNRARGFAGIIAGVLILGALWTWEIGWVGAIWLAVCLLVASGLFAIALWPLVVWASRQRIVVRADPRHVIAVHRPLGAFFQSKVWSDELAAVWAARATRASRYFGRYVVRARYHNGNLVTVVEGLKTADDAVALGELVRDHLGLREAPEAASVRDDPRAAKTKQPTAGWILTAAAGFAVAGALLTIALLTNAGQELGQMPLSDDLSSLDIVVPEGALDLGFYLDAESTEPMRFIPHDFDVAIEVHHDGERLWQSTCDPTRSGIYAHDGQYRKKVRLPCSITLPGPGRYEIRARRIWLEPDERSSYPSTILCPTVYENL